MTDFLDALIDRHTNAAPRIVPRLASIYEPEVAAGGWDAAASNDASEMEETFYTEPADPMKETARTHVGITDFQALAIPATPAASSATIEPTAEKTGLDIAGPKPAGKTGLYEPEFSFPGRAKVFESSKPWACTPITPAMGSIGHEPEEARNEHVSLHREATPEDHAFVNKAHAENNRVSGKAGLKEPTFFSSKEMADNTKITETLAADLIAPVKVTVRPVRQEEHVEQKPEPTQVTEGAPFFSNKNPAGSEFPLATQETMKMREVNSASDRINSTFPEKDQGILNPSAVLIAPAMLTAAGLERPASQPEPVINVTIGRIEVRATVPPQKQSSKPANRPPMMGLDEYLHRRSEGHDR